VLDWHFAFGWWGWVGGEGWTDKAACLLGPTSSPRSMIRLSSRIGKRYLEVFHVSQAVVRTHGSIVGRFEGFRWSKEGHGGGGEN
jgi:hypothetical protein